MKLVMTMMVRDEADIVGAMIAHHAAQGIDRLIVTDNGSVDGTADILADPRWGDLLDVRHDPVHRKQQHSVVTGMARDAFTRYRADWVINADADEFWLPVDRSLTLRQALENTPTSIGSFIVPVIDMIGAPAWRGSGVSRLRYRDNRSQEELQEIGIFAHSTPDAVHVGRADVEVAQGNHFVNIESDGVPDPAYALEVLHLPWRSWEQFERKVEASGRAYESNPDLAPSPNHHGMREYARWKRGVLFDFYVARHPSADALSRGVGRGTFEPEPALDAVLAPVPDEPLDLAPDIAQIMVDTAKRQVVLEDADRRRAQAATQTLSEFESLRRQVFAERAEHERALATLEAERSARIAELEQAIDGYRRRKVVRALDTGVRIAHTAVHRAEALQHSTGSTTPRQNGAPPTPSQSLEMLVTQPPRALVTRGSVSKDDLPVLVEVGDDPVAAEGFLAFLDTQQLDRGIRVMVWTPGENAARAVAEAVHVTQPSVVRSIEVFAAPIDIGRFGSFLLGRIARDGGAHGAAVLIEPDQRGPVTAVRDLLTAWSPSRIVATSAFLSAGSFWRRNPAPNGVHADIVGIDGTVIDLDLVDDAFFQGIPPHFRALADQWMTHRARLAGWRIEGMTSGLEHLPSITSGQSADRWGRSAEFDRYLRDLGGETAEPPLAESRTGGADIPR